MPYAIVIDDELEPSEQPPGRRSKLPDSYHPEADADGALALLALIKQVATPRIRVDHYWSPREAKARILAANEAPLVLIIDIVNEREGTETRLSMTDRRCGLVLARIAAEKWPRTPILFLTQLDCHDEQDALREAADVRSFEDFITKRTSATKNLLQSRLEKIFKPFLDQVLETGELKIETVRYKTYWRGFELGTVARKCDYQASGGQSRSHPYAPDAARVPALTVHDAIRPKDLGETRAHPTGQGPLQRYDQGHRRARRPLHSQAREGYPQKDRKC